MEQVKLDEIIGAKAKQINLNRFLQQWLMVWNGYDGNIYITSAKTLPNFVPPQILIEKTSPDQKNWYPNLISEQTGDRVGGQDLHLYYRDFPEGPGKGSSYFRKTSFKLKEVVETSSSTTDVSTTTTTKTTTTTTTTTATTINTGKE